MRWTTDWNDWQVPLDLSKWESSIHRDTAPGGLLKVVYRFIWSERFRDPVPVSTMTSKQNRKKDGRRTGGLVTVRFTEERHKNRIIPLSIYWLSEQKDDIIRKNWYFLDFASCFDSFSGKIVMMIIATVWGDSRRIKFQFNSASICFLAETEVSIRTYLGYRTRQICLGGREGTKTCAEWSNKHRLKGSHHLQKPLPNWMQGHAFGIKHWERVFSNVGGHFAAI